jgi:hypothetical protein
VPETTIPDRRDMPPGGDRRRKSRGGRRAGDPRFNWRRVAWLFTFYALYLSARSLPTRVKNVIRGVASRLPS